MEYLPVELFLLTISFLDISTKSSLKYVIKSNHLSKHLHTNQEYHIILSNAISEGHTELFKWLIPNKQFITAFLTHGYCDIAAKHGQLDILKYLVELPFKQ